MAKSKKSYLLELPEVHAGLETTETKTIEYENHKFSYTVDRYTMYKDYYAVEVVGGPFNIRATTTCKGRSIKKQIKMLIKSLLHK